MRCPNSISLSDWIRALEHDDMLYKFYKTQEWKQLRDEVLRDHHHECARCKREGRFGYAYTVHHIHEVRHHPELALTRYLDGKEILEPICLRCHNDEHHRFGKHQSNKAPLTVERW